eukprot:g42.t1
MSGLTAGAFARAKDALTAGPPAARAVAGARALSVSASLPAGEEWGAKYADMLMAGIHAETRGKRILAGYTGRLWAVCGGRGVLGYVPYLGTCERRPEDYVPPLPGELVRGKQRRVAKGGAGERGAALWREAYSRAKDAPDKADRRARLKELDDYTADCGCGGGGHFVHCGLALVPAGPGEGLPDGSGPVRCERLAPGSAGVLPGAVLRAWLRALWGQRR